MHRAFERLTAQDRDLLRLQYDRDMPYETLAERFGIARGTVKSRFHRARLHLRWKLHLDLLLAWLRPTTAAGRLRN